MLRSIQVQRLMEFWLSIHDTNLLGLIKVPGFQICRNFLQCQYLRHFKFKNCNFIKDIWKCIIFTLWTLRKFQTNGNYKGDLSERFTKKKLQQDKVFWGAYCVVAVNASCRLDTFNFKAHSNEAPTRSKPRKLSQFLLDHPVQRTYGKC